MGTANTQIAKYENVTNKRIHNGFSASYATTATKCVTKGELKKVEFLEAKDRTTTSNIYYDINSNLGVYTPATLKINNIATSTSSIRSSNIYKTTYTYDYTTIAQCAIRYTTSLSAYSTVNIQYASGFPENDSDNPNKYALFVKQLTGVTPGLTKLQCTLSLEGISSNSPTTQSSNGNPATYGISNPNISYAIIVTDSNGQIIAKQFPANAYSNTANFSITFSVSTSTIYVYLIFPSITFSFTNGQTTYYAGFSLKATTAITSYASNYDFDTKCVQYQDINHPSGKQFTVYYGVWNNKSSNAKLNNLYVQIKKTSESSWTTIGTATLPSSLNSTTTGSVTCTLPASYDPTVQYDFRVTAGETNSAQQWYYRWGSQSTLSNSGYSWTYYGKYKTGVCTNANGLNTHSSYSTLRNHAWTTTTLSRGRSASLAALFCIE
jgi:hypothetical protein